MQLQLTSDTVSLWLKKMTDTQLMNFGKLTKNTVTKQGKITNRVRYELNSLVLGELSERLEEGTWRAK